MDADAGRPVNDLGTVGVIARPPLLFAGALAIGLASDRVLPPVFTLRAPGKANWIVGGVLVVFGLALASAGIRNFSRAATPVPTSQPTRALVTTGIHRRTRNPIYLGMFLLYAGIATAARSAGALVLMVPLAMTMRYGVVAREEAYLERRFGEAYRSYKRAVRRWL